MEAYKNIYFHKLDIYKRLFIKKKGQADTQAKNYLDSKGRNSLLDDIIANRLKNNCITIKDETGSRMLEILDHDKDYIFARIGKFQDLLTVHLRNKKTYVPEEISRTVDQELEIFTYFLIDRDNYVISFLKELSAPPIRTLQYLIDNNFGHQDIFGEIKGVIVEDAIPLLKDKDTIGTISYKVAVPSDNVLSYDDIGLSQKEFIHLRNQKHAEIEVKLVAERNKSAFESGNGIEEVLKKILSRTSRVKVRAKDDGGYMQSYDVVESLLTKRVKFEFDRDAEQIQKEIFSKLKTTYETNKQEIVNYVRKE
ncbi:hypothetical protein [Bacillus mesophilum]|uniref:Uncharacterized protein n=1 Tax=Bacillus mesophilum TaxID=1071718 RepID=A0A7V7RNX9_9BACI|nr:hypothetical protein [Bacillus mesophilum]KAB2334275.1 hypothetical protein F7732_09400 [Bacillus mesophilum]